MFEKFGRGSIDRVTLRPGVDSTDFERFVADEVLPTRAFTDRGGGALTNQALIRLMKGDGSRGSEYLWLLESAGAGSLSHLRGSPFKDETTSQKFDSLATSSPYGMFETVPYSTEPSR
jgi:hypothetical protein